MNLNVTYDANTLASAPSGFFSAVDYVVNLFDATFTNNVTVNIEVGYGDFPYDGSSVTPFLGENLQNNIVSADYSQVRQILVSEGTSGASTLPSSSPISGQLQLGSAQEKALGLIGSSSSLDGWVGIASNAELRQLDGTSWSFSSTAPSSNQYYLVGVIEHEFSEVMGRNSYLTDRGEYGILDLYRYAGSGVRQTGTGDPAYFSIDGGNTNLDSFNNVRVAAGDLSDWAPNAGRSGAFHYAGADAFLNNSLTGQINGLSSTDLTVMAALGWDGTPAGVASNPVTDQQLQINTNPGPTQPPPNDFNGDGKSDILWENGTSTWIWEMDGTTQIGGGPAGTGGAGWQIAGTGDFNGDGKSDILWENSSTNGVWIWEMDGTKQIGGGSLGQGGAGWKIADTGDFNGDGKSDILWENGTSTWIWEMDGTTQIGGGPAGTGGAGCTIAGTGDFNGDGKSDILWENGTSTWIWEMDGTKVIGGGPAGTGGAGWQIVGIGDSGSTTAAAAGGGAQSSGTAFTFADISADRASAGGATAATTGLVSASQSRSGADALLLPSGSTTPLVDPAMSRGTLFG